VTLGIGLLIALGWNTSPSGEQAYHMVMRIDVGNAVCYLLGLGCSQGDATVSGLRYIPLIMLDGRAGKQG
jgi:hypothetical protein